MAMEKIPSRRQFLKDVGKGLKLGAWAGAGAALGIGYEKTRHNERNSIYESGDTIKTEVGDFKVDGWHLQYNEAEVKKIARVSLNSEQGGLSKNVSSLARGMQNVALPGQGVWTLKIDIGNETYEYKILPLYHTYENPTSPFYAEVELSTENLQTARRIQQAFGNIVNDPVYVYKSSEHNGFYVDEKRVEISSAVAQSPTYEGQFECVLTHELAHAVVSRIRHAVDQTNNLDLARVFETLGGFTGARNSLLEGEKGLLVNIFDESSFQKNQKVIDGHPYDNHDELFASILTVLRMHPEQLAQRIQDLLKEKNSMKEIAILNNLRAREAVRQIIRILTQLLEENSPFEWKEGANLETYRAQRKEYNEKIRKKLKLIIPKIDELEKGLRLDSLQDEMLAMFEKAGIR